MGIGGYSVNKIQSNRDFMKVSFRELDENNTDIAKGVPRPLLQKGLEEEGQIIDLPGADAGIIVKDNVYSCMTDRQSRRKYSGEILSLSQLSLLLYTTQGVKRVIGDNIVTLRNVPSGGARHPFETYLVINRVEGLKKGVYRYLPIEHSLVFLFNDENMEAEIDKAVLDQPFVSKAPVIFIWSCVPYRGEYVYGVTAHKMMLMDMGHVCQNLYLSCEALGLGTCAVGAYDQQAMDGFLRLDGRDEFTLYMAPVGIIEK